MKSIKDLQKEEQFFLMEEAEKEFHQRMLEITKLYVDNDLDTNNCPILLAGVCAMYQRFINLKNIVENEE